METVLESKADNMGIVEGSSGESISRNPSTRIEDATVPVTRDGDGRGE
jgi:hypothetical protein